MDDPIEALDLGTVSNTPTAEPPVAAPVPVQATPVQKVEAIVPARAHAPVAPSEVDSSLSIEGVIQLAILNHTPIETMEKLLAMRKELRAEKAKEDFDKAMAAFQKACPVIKKEKEAKNDKGEVMYRYAPLGSIVSQVKEALGDNELSYSTQVEKLEKTLKVTCTAKHISGHSESSSMETPYTTKTNMMSDPQQLAATATFAKRYAFNDVFGIMTGDEDTDTQEKEADAGPPKESGIVEKDFQ